MILSALLEPLPMKCRLLKRGVCTLFSVAVIVAGALPCRAQNEKLYVPELQANDAAELGLALLNPTSREAKKALTARTYSGALIQSDQITNPVELTIPAACQKSLTAAEIFRKEIFGRTGWVELSASTPAVKSSFFVEAQGRSYSDSFFSQFVEGGHFYTGLAVLNPNSVPTKVTLDTLDYTGNSTGATIVILNPGERKSALLGEFLERVITQMSGYVRITSTLPIFALEFSRDSSAFLANVSPLSRSSVPITVQLNQPPTVNAGPDQTITLPSGATLNGTASDDGFPSGTITTRWSKVSGPGTVAFGNASAKRTTATFSASGTYVLRLTASDSVLTATDDVSIVVNSATTSSGSSGTTYYVSNSGSNSNSGTSQSSPWKTVAKVQSFKGNLRPGDSVLFQRGGIWYETLDLSNINGSASAPITLGNYGSGNLPIIDGGGTKSGYSISGGRPY